MTTHTLRLIDEYLTQGGYAPNIDADTLDRETALIAAAPDLLEALAFLEPHLNALPVFEYERVKIRAAITKATGA